MEKTVIFDMDGVIFDTEQLSQTCWREVAAAEKMAGMDEFFLLCIGMNKERTKELYESRYSHPSFAVFDQKTTDLFFAHIEQHGMPMKPGVVELLEFLKRHSFKIGLASSTRKAVVTSQLASRDLLAYFQVVIGGDMVKKSKPEPDIFLRACKEIGTEPAAAYAVEDSYNGIIAAGTAGMKAIMVPDMVAPDEEIRNRAHCVLSSLDEVQEFLKEEYNIG